MYYDPRSQSSGLPRDPFTSLVVPRPIGWISTVSESGVVNLAPYSFFNAVSVKPPFVMFSSIGTKDTLRNIEATGEFTTNLASFDLRRHVHQSSMEYDALTSEPEAMRLSMTPSLAVRPPRVTDAPAALECRHVRTIAVSELWGAPHPASIVIGEVLGIYISDAVIKDGLVDLTAVPALARLGYREYTAVGEAFTVEAG